MDLCYSQTQSVRIESVHIQTKMFTSSTHCLSTFTLSTWWAISAKALCVLVFHEAVHTPKQKQDQQQKSKDMDTPPKHELTYKAGCLSMSAKRDFLSNQMEQGFCRKTALDNWEQRRSQLLENLSDAEKRRRRFAPSLKSQSMWRVTFSNYCHNSYQLKSKPKQTLMGVVFSFYTQLTIVFTSI
jgi:hypothetical protein